MGFKVSILWLMSEDKSLMVNRRPADLWADSSLSLMMIQKTAWAVIMTTGWLPELVVQGEEWGLRVSYPLIRGDIFPIFPNLDWFGHSYPLRSSITWEEAFAGFCLTRRRRGLRQGIDGFLQYSQTMWCWRFNGIILLSVKCYVNVTGFHFNFLSCWFTRLRTINVIGLLIM